MDALRSTMLAWILTGPVNDFVLNAFARSPTNTKTGT